MKTPSFDTDPHGFRGPITFFSGRWTKADAGRLKGVQLGSVRISHRDGWEGEDLSFLEGRADVRSMVISLANRATDLSALSSLRNLTTLSLLRPEPKVTLGLELGAMASLRELQADWHPELSGVKEASGLESLSLRDLHRVKSLDLSGMPNLRVLRVLGGSSMQQLDLEGTSRIVALVLIKLPKLEQIRGLRGPECVYLAARGLKKLDKSFLRELNALETVQIAPGDNIVESDFDGKPRLVKAATHLGILPSLPGVNPEYTKFG